MGRSQTTTQYCALAAARFLCALIRPPPPSVGADVEIEAYIINPLSRSAPTRLQLLVQTLRLQSLRRLLRLLPFSRTPNSAFLALLFSTLREPVDTSPIFWSNSAGIRNAPPPFRVRLRPLFAFGSAHPYCHTLAVDRLGVGVAEQEGHD